MQISLIESLALFNLEGVGLARLYIGGINTRAGVFIADVECPVGFVGVVIDGDAVYGLDIKPVLAFVPGDKPGIEQSFADSLCQL